MALIALAADKGSPGVTTAAVALSAVWPRRALLAEVDTAGGDLVYRGAADHGGPLDPNTGMLSLAAAARRGLAAEQLWEHAQRLSGGLDVLVGLGNAEQSAGLAGQWDTLGRAFASLAVSPRQEAAADVIADCGRIGPDAPSVALFPHAALVLLVARGEPEQIARVRDRAAALSQRLHGGQRGMAQLAQPLLGVVLIAEASGAAKIAGQVNDMLVASRAGAQVLGVVAHDAAGAEQLAGRRRGRVEKSLLVRSVRKVAADLQQQYAGIRDAAPGGPDAVPGGPDAVPSAQLPGTPPPEARPYPEARTYPEARPYPPGQPSPGGQSTPDGRPTPGGQPYPPGQPYPSAQPYPSGQPSPSTQPSPPVQPSPPAAPEQRPAAPEQRPVAPEQRRQPQWQPSSEQAEWRPSSEQSRWQPQPEWNQQFERVDGRLRPRSGPNAAPAPAPDAAPARGVGQDPGTAPAPAPGTVPAPGTAAAPGTVPAPGDEGVAR